MQADRIPEAGRPKGQTLDPKPNSIPPDFTSPPTNETLVNATLSGLTNPIAGALLATPLQLIAEPRKATSERCCEAVSGPRPEGRDMVALRWAIGLKWLPQRLLDVLHDFLRITELIEVIDEFPFAAGSDQIGESRVIH